MRIYTAFLARALALSWAGFWLIFFVAESLAWHTPLHVMALWTGVGLLFLFVAVAAWRWEVAGGFLLLGLGVCFGIAYVIWAPPGLPLASRIAATASLSVPPLAAGILFVIRRRTYAEGA